MGTPTLPARGRGAAPDHSRRSPPREPGQPGVPVRWRLGPLAGAGVALLAGLYAALLLLELPVPSPRPEFAETHGPLMVFGFVGSLVAVERAVAVGTRLALAAPACSGAAALILVLTGPSLAGKALLAAGGMALLCGYLVLWRRQPSVALLAQACGAAAWYAAALLWLAGFSVPEITPWMAIFVVATIAGERLELAHLVLTGPAAERWFLAALAALVGGGTATTLLPTVGSHLFGAGLLAVVGWLVRFDVARKLIRGRGLPRYIAAGLLAGYAWLALAGTLWTVAGVTVDGPRYDATLHAVFVGFTMSMIFVHAPVILPAVLRRPLPYRPVLYLPLALLHASLLVRVWVGDALGMEEVWRWSAVANIAAVLLFAGSAVTLSIRALNTGGTRSAAPAGRDRAAGKGGTGRVGTGRASAGRASWHRRTGVLPLAYFAGIVVVALTHPFLPSWRWLAIHLLLLGAATNAIVVWSTHFAAAILRAPTHRRAEGARLAVLNLGVVLVLAGGVVDRPWWGVGGAALVFAAVAAHLAALARRLRAALPARFAITVRYYLAAGGALLTGIPVGAWMLIDDDSRPRLTLFHAHINLLGWITLTALGTVLTFWPTVLRTRMADGAGRAATISLRLASSGLVLLGTGVLGWWPAVGAGGVGLVAAAVVVTVLPAARAARARPPASFAAWSIAASGGWLLVALGVDAWTLLTAGDAATAANRFTDVLVPLLAGFVGQLLLGALAYLLPVGLGGGPTVVRRHAAMLDRHWAQRVAMGNAALAVFLLPIPPYVRITTSLLLLAALVQFLVPAIRVLLSARR